MEDDYDCDDDDWAPYPEDPINLIEPGIYIGNLYAAENGEILRENNIQKIVAVLEDFRLRKTFEEIEYLNIEILDSMYTDITQYIPSAISFISKAQSEGKNVLVHCAMGISRSPSFVIAYLMVKYNYDFDTAKNLTYSKRKGICPNSGFEQQLRALSVSDYKQYFN